MAVVVDNGTAHVVVVARLRTVAAVSRQVDSVAVAAPGVQGRPGDQGPDGSGDNETFDTNLALLYSIAKI